MSEDPDSDFGEFVRIQASSSECNGWDLPALLRKPVERLSKYPAQFKVRFFHLIYALVVGLTIYVLLGPSRADTS